MAFRGGEFGVAQRTDQGNDAAEDPGGKHCPHAAGAGSDHGRRLEYAGADDDANDQRDRVSQLEHRLGPSRLLRYIAALLIHGDNYAWIALHGQVLW